MQVSYPNVSIYKLLGPLYQELPPSVSNLTTKKTVVYVTGIWWRDISSIIKEE